MRSSSDSNRSYIALHTELFFTIHLNKHFEFFIRYGLISQRFRRGMRGQKGLMAQYEVQEDSKSVTSTALSRSASSTRIISSPDNQIKTNQNTDDEENAIENEENKSVTEELIEENEVKSTTSRVPTPTDEVENAENAENDAENAKNDAENAENADETPPDGDDEENNE